MTIVMVAQQQKLYTENWFASKSFRIFRIWKVINWKTTNFRRLDILGGTLFVKQEGMYVLNMKGSQ